MLLVPSVTPRVVEELPRDPIGDEAAITALERAVEEKVRVHARGAYAVRTRSERACACAACA